MSCNDNYIQISFAISLQPLICYYYVGMCGYCCATGVQHTSAKSGCELVTLLSIEGYCCCPLSTGFQNTSVKSGCELVTFFICKVSFAKRWLTAIYVSHLATEARIFSIAYCRNYAHYDVFRLKMKQQGRQYIMTSRV